MGRLAQTSRETAGQTTGVVWVPGRHRLPSDVLSELMDVLAAQPRIVVCDMSGMADTPQTMVELFAPVAEYLAGWPGTLVVACVGQPATHARMLPAAISERLLVHARCEAGVEEARRLLQPMEHAMTYLPPVPAAAGDARRFARLTLRDWGLGSLVGPASLVVSELVTDSLLHAHTVVGLSLSRCEDRVRIGVHDHGGGRPALPTGEPSEDGLDGRGLLVVQALTRCWGSFPTRAHGKTVWALMDANVT